MEMGFMKNKLLLTLALSLAPLAASAGDVSYSYIEASFSRTELEVNHEYFLDQTLTGGFIRGSLALGDAFYLHAGYEGGSDFNFLGPDTEFWELQFSLGYHTSLSPQLDFIAEGGLINSKLTIEDIWESESSSDSGFRVSSGLRAEFLSRLEGLATANYSNTGDGGGDISATLGLQYKFSKTWRLLGELELGGDTPSSQLGVRISF
jgi:Outer membrane protein beta-barrel domain